MPMKAAAKARFFLFFTMIAVATILSFQNCGKAGFEDIGDTGSLSLSSVSKDSRITSAPLPVETELNLISYMSCPLAGSSKARSSDDLKNPFYTIRAGAFDNMSYAQVFNATSYTTEEQYRRLKGGIGISKAFKDHLNTNFLRSDEQMLYQGLTGHPATQGVRPALALIYGERSKEEGGFGFDTGFVTPVLSPLNDASFAHYLTRATANGSSGLLKESFFSAFDSSQRTLVGSIAWGNSEVDRDKLAGQLPSLYLVAGYLNDSYGKNITALESPTGNNLKTVYGRGYQLSFSNQSLSPGTLQSYKSHMLKYVNEYNMETSPISAINNGGTPNADTNRNWDCFSLVIVRHNDRLDPLNGHPLQKCINPVTNQYTTQTYGVCDYRTPTGTIIYGARRICPVQTVTSLNSSSLNMLRLQMARRVLPAEFWEINTDPNYMCAVPSDSATTAGKCYASGDQDASKYIQYSNTISCGTGSNECAAHVSICYRTR